MNFVSDTASTNRILSQSEKNIHVQPSACLNSLPQRNKNATSYFMGVTYSQIPVCHTKLFVALLVFSFKTKNMRILSLNNSHVNFKQTPVFTMKTECTISLHQNNKSLTTVGAIIELKYAN